MNHLFDQLIAVSEANNSPENIEKFAPLGFDGFERILDKGIIVDKIAGNYDVSSTLPVGSDGFPSNGSQAANMFMIYRPVGINLSGFSYWGWEQVLNYVFGVEPGSNLDTNLHHVPSVAALQSNYLTTAQLSNFLSWTPVGTEFPQSADINALSAQAA